MERPGTLENQHFNITERRLRVQTHSIDSYITDSANSASALYSGHKSTVNALGVYVDSSPDYFDDPKVETIVELLRRIWV